MNTLKKTVDLCRKYGFNEELTREMLWNTAYGLGRSRWYWGPRWFVNVVGWFNSQRSRFGL